jgi:F420-dependent oxidoreductase-like protein
LLALVGAEVPDVELGTAVVPIYARHPQVLAQQALTVQAGTADRLVLGIGLSHQLVVEGLWGLSYDKPVRAMREYLSALLPMLHGETVAVHGDTLTAVTVGPLEVPGVQAPPVLVAALGPAMLALAGSEADGTVTWMTGTATVADHIVPTITAAAEAAGRPAPRVVVNLPATVTADVEAARQRIDERFAIYPSLPSYRAMLDREGASTASDISLVGSEEEVAAGLARLREAGATDVVIQMLGDREERSRTAALLTGEAGALA